MAIFEAESKILDVDKFPWGYKVPPLWTPLSPDTKTMLWLDASDASTITLDVSTNIEQWRDKSGKGNHASAPAAGQRPALVAAALDGKNIIRFDGTDDVLRGVNSASRTAFICVVYKVRTHNINYARIFIWRDATADGTSFSIGPVSGEQIIAQSVATSGVGRMYQVALDTWHIFAGNHPQGGVGSETFIINGVAATTTASTPVSVAAITSANSYSIGARWDASYSTLDIAEIIVFENGGDRQKVEAFLAKKWGMVSDFPVDYPYTVIPLREFSLDTSAWMKSINTALVVPAVPTITSTAKLFWTLTYNANGADAAVNVATGGTASASSTSGANVAARAFDGDTATYWYGTSGTDQWLEYDLGAGNDKIVDAIRIYVGNTLYQPKDIIFQAYNGSAWVDLMSGTVVNVVAWYYYPVQNETAYQRYRLFIKTGYSTILWVYELQLMTGNTPAATSHENNSTVTVASAGSMVRTGFTFAGWDTGSLGGGTFYNPADTFTITGNVLLYAQWTSV